MKGYWPERFVCAVRGHRWERRGATEQILGNLAAPVRCSRCQRSTWMREAALNPGESK